MKKQLLAFATIFMIGTGGSVSNAFAAEHKVQSGETLQQISTQYSMTVDEVKQLNGLSSDVIYEDSTLKVLSKEDTYTIQPGDTLFEIGIAKHATVDQLMKWNNITNGDLIFAEEKLAVSAEAGELKMKAVPVAQQVQEAQAPAQQENLQAQADTQSTQASAQNNQSSEPQGQTFTVSATAYTAYCTGCSGITADGTDLRANPNLKVIAVDPTVIPLGTRVYVEGYGEAIAADTGGAIKGNKIDVFIPTQESALNWGRRNVQVTILN